MASFSDNKDSRDSHGNHEDTYLPYIAAQTGSSINDIAELKSAYVYLEAERKELKELIKEMQEKKFPWLPIAGILTPVILVFSGFSFQNILQVNLTSDRIIAMQKTMAEYILESKEQNGRFLDDIKELRNRIDNLERREVGNRINNLERKN